MFFCNHRQRRILSGTMIRISVNFFLFFAISADCHLKVSAKSVIMLWSMREKIPSHAKNTAHNERN
jgi:hypothetical protein